MDLSLSGLRILMGVTFPQLVALGGIVVMALAIFWARRSARDPEYRSFRATTHNDARQAVVALGVSLGVAAALIVIAPLIAGLIRG